MAEIISTGGKCRQHGAGPAKVEQLQIDRVIGLTPPNSGTVAHCPSHADLLAYPAGAFAVVYNSSSRQQLRLLRSTTSNAQLGCIAWSANGEQLAAGEAGLNPSIIVWDWSSSECMAELKAHKYSIACVRFSQTNGKLLLSAGGANDGLLCIWDWKAGSVLWRQNVAAELTSAVFTEDSSCVLALGKGIFKAWSVSTAQAGKQRGKAAAAGSGGSLSLTPRAVTLRELQGSRFVDVAVAPSPPSQPPGSNGVYALVATGVLVLMRPTGRVIDKSVNLQVPAAYALAAGPTQVAAACAQGVVRLFSCKSLAFRATLPRFVARGQGSAAGAGAAAEDRFPDAQGCSFYPGTEQQLVVVYADMSMIVWDIQDAKKITCLQTLSAHSSSIWDVCPITAPGFGIAGFQQQQQPSRCATCAADGTVRIWNLSADVPPGTGRLLPAVAAAQGRPSGHLRCMRISTDGRHVCVGDQAGTLRVFDSVTLRLLVQQEAHDCEVLCLDYSPLMQAGSCLAASGSRDTLIHVYDARAGYALLQTLDEHSAAVTGVRFTAGGKGLVSCGADRSIIFRVLGGGVDSGSAAYHIETLPHSMLFDLVVDPLDQYVVTTGQDGLLRQWDVATGSLQRTLAPEAGAGEPIKLCIDPGGVVLICCHVDGCLRLYHLASGQLLWRAWGHSEMVAAAMLSSDLTKLVSVGGDGCVIVWKLPEQLVQEVQAAVARVASAKLHLDAVSQQQQGQQLQQVSVQPDGAPSGKQVAWAASAAAASANASAAATPSLTSLPGVSTALGTCPSSESGVTAAVLRVRQGKPLVSTDKLPKWARSPATSTSGPSSPAGSASGQAKQQQQQQQQLYNRWFGGRQQTRKSNKWQTAQQADDGSDDACRRLSLESNSSTLDGGSKQHPDMLLDADGALPQASTGQPEQQGQGGDDQQSPGWPQDDDMVVIQDWDDSSLAQYNALDVAAGTATADGQAEAAAAEEVDRGVQQKCQQQQETSWPTASLGGERVARDLFKEHFSSLGGAGPQAGLEDANLHLRTQDFRQSLSAMFKAGRASLGGLLPLRSQPVSSAGGSVPASHDTSSSEAYTCSSAADVEGAASPLRLSTDDDQMHPGEGPAAAAVKPSGAQPLPPCSNGGLSAVSSAGTVADEQLLSGQTSPKRRWRVGKMDAELAGMRERLASLQALYQQQMLQRQLSPRRGRSCGNTDDHMQLAAQQAVAAEAREAKQGRFATDGGAAAGKGLQEGKTAGCSASDNTTAADSSSSIVPGLDDSKGQQGEAAAVPKAVQSEVPPLPPGPVPAAALSTAAPHRTGPEPDASPPPAASSTAAVVVDAAAAVAAAPEEPENLSVSDPNAAGPVADADAVRPASPGLLAQLLSDSPDVPSIVAARSPSIDSAAAAAAGAARGAPTPLNMTSVLDAAAAAAASPGSLANGSAAGSGSTSPALPRSPAGLLLHAGSHLIDSIYRVSIGNSITAVDNSTSLGGAPRSDSPAKCALSLQGPLADAPTLGATRRSPSGGRVLSRAAETPAAAAAAAVDEQPAAAPRSTEQLQQPELVSTDSADGTAEAAADAAAAADGDSLQVSQAAVREGVTITPHGQHVMWPGWGSQGAWEGLTPSPGSSVLAPKLAATFDPAATPTTAAAAGDAAGSAASGLMAEGSAVSTESSATAVVAEEPRFWLQQNPCYDMTPLSSTPGSAVTSSNGRASSWAKQVAIAEAAADVAGLLAPGNSSPRQPRCSSSPDAQQQEEQELQQHVPPTAAKTESPHCQQLEQQEVVMDEHSAPNSPQHLALQEQPQQAATSMHAQEQQWQQGDPGFLSVAPLRRLQHLQEEQPEDPFFAEVRSGGSFVTGAADSLPVSPTSSLTPPGSSKGSSKSQARRDKAAAKAAVKAAKAAAAEQERQAGFGSPGSSMMSLLQRIKRTMPSIKHRPGSGSGSGSSCTGSRAISTASPIKDSPRDSSTSGNGHNLSSCATSRAHAEEQLFVQSLGSWSHDAQQQQQQGALRQRTTSDSASGDASPDDVCLDMVPEQGPMHAEQHSSQQHSSALPQAAVPADAAVPCSPAGSQPVAGRSSTAAQLAATMEQFRQSAQQMQQLWVQLQSLSLDSDEGCKLQQLLTPHKAAAAAAAAATAVPPAGGGAATPGPGSSSSQQRTSAEPTQLVKQLVQEEVLQTIYGLHAAVMGLPSNASGQLLPGGSQLSAGGHGSPPGTPSTACTASPLQPWQMHSVCSPQQQHSVAAGHTSHSFGYVAAGGAAAMAAAEVTPSSPALSVYSQSGLSLEALTSRICEQYTETLLQKLEERRQQDKKQERGQSPTKQQGQQAQQQRQQQQEQTAAST
ncbi:hypothetical protein COO60DRAFT_8922 [Scenedesmus sp. NREL 46B-D3]|nr:hypothetical protein COO60DRAFT_8922 [Scenedesmus sp. NREL 46B-D3]